MLYASGWSLAFLLYVVSLVTMSPANADQNRANAFTKATTIQAQHQK